MSSDSDTKRSAGVSGLWEAVSRTRPVTSAFQPSSAPPATARDANCTKAATPPTALDRNTTRPAGCCVHRAINAVTDATVASAGRLCTITHSDGLVRSSTPGVQITLGPTVALKFAKMPSPVMRAGRNVTSHAPPPSAASSGTQRRVAGVETVSVHAARP